jgi:hypothetical protein
VYDTVIRNDKKDEKTEECEMKIKKNCGGRIKPKKRGRKEGREEDRK